MKAAKAGGPGGKAGEATYKRDTKTLNEKFSHGQSIGHEDHPDFWDYKEKRHKPEHQECFLQLLAAAEGSEWGSLKGSVWDEDMIHRHCCGQKNTFEKSWECYEKAMTQHGIFHPNALTVNDARIAIDEEIIIVHNKDKHKRPIVYVKLQRFQFGKLGKDVAAACLFFYLEEAIKQLNDAGNEEKCLFVVDVENCGMGNFNREFIKHITPLLNTYYSERVGCIYVLNPNWFFRSVWSVVCLFLDPVTKTKVEFVPHASIEAKLREMVSEDMLLQEYGGASLHPSGMHIYMDKSYPPGREERMTAMELVALRSQAWYKSMKARQAWAMASDENKVKRALAATSIQQAILGFKNHNRLKLNQSLLGLFSNKDLQDGIPVNIFKAVMCNRGEFKPQAKTQWDAIFVPLLDTTMSAKMGLVDAAKFVEEVWKRQDFGVKLDAPVSERRSALLSSLLGICTQRQSSSGVRLEESPLLSGSGTDRRFLQPVVTSHLSLDTRVATDGSAPHSLGPVAATLASGVMSPRSRRGGLTKNHHNYTRIFVKVLKGKAIALDVDPQDTIAKIKTYIEKQCQVPAGDQMLLFTGRELVDDRSISDYNIQQCGHPLLVLRVRKAGAPRATAPDGTYYVITPDHHWPGTDFMPTLGGQEVLVTMPSCVNKGSGSIEAKTDQYGMAVE